MLRPPGLCCGNLGMQLYQVLTLSANSTPEKLMAQALQKLPARLHAAAAAVRLL